MPELTTNEINPFKLQDIPFAEFPAQDIRYASEIMRGVKEFQVGSGATSFNANESGIWLGGKTFDIAPFRVDMNGVMRATSGTFSGSITGSTITGSTITGGTIQTASSGKRIVMNGATSELQFYNISNVLVGELYAGTSSVSLHAGTNYYYFNEYSFYPYNNTDLGSYFSAWGDLYLIGTANLANVDATDTVYGERVSAGTNGFYSYWGDLVLSNGAITLGVQTINQWSDLNSYITAGITSLSELSINTTKNWGGYGISNIGTLGAGAITGTSLSAGSGTLRAGGYHYFNSGNNSVWIYSTGSNLSFNDGSGSFSSLNALKTAILPTSNGYNAVYCMESPEVWFMDFCSSKENIDPLFLETTVAPYKFIQCDDGSYQVWGKRKGHDNVRFEEKTHEEYLANEKYLRMARPDFA